MGCERDGRRGGEGKTVFSGNKFASLNDVNLFTNELDLMSYKLVKQEFNKAEFCSR